MTAYGTSLTAGYTGDNLRAWKQDNLGNRTYFLYDGTDVIAELDATGTLTAYQTWGGNGLVSRHTSSGSLFYTFDPVGSVSTVTNSAGAVQGDEAFDATGKRLGSFASSPVSFCGQWGYYEDVETGLLLCGHRYYDPYTARFLNRDPIGFDGGINLSGYSRNNYIMAIDPEGTDPTQIVECELQFSDCLARAVLTASLAAGRVYTSCIASAAYTTYYHCLPLWYTSGPRAFYKCVADGAAKAEPVCRREASDAFNRTLAAQVNACAIQFVYCIECPIMS